MAVVVLNLFLCVQPYVREQKYMRTSMLIIQVGFCLDETLSWLHLASKRSYGVNVLQVVDSLYHLIIQSHLQQELALEDCTIHACLPFIKAIDLEFLVILKTVFD